MKTLSEDADTEPEPLRSESGRESGVAVKRDGSPTWADGAAGPSGAKKMRTAPTNTSLLPPCKVCHQPAAGFHYGANTCEACKGFFRRSLLRVEPYRCLGKDNCNIRAGKRKICPRCRYRRCLHVGMSKEAIKTGRYTHAKRTKDVLEYQQTMDLINQGGPLYSYHGHYNVLTNDSSAPALAQGAGPSDARGSLKNPSPVVVSSSADSTLLLDGPLELSASASASPSDCVSSSMDTLGCHGDKGVSSSSPFSSSRPSRSLEAVTSPSSSEQSPEKSALQNSLSSTSSSQPVSHQSVENLLSSERWTVPENSSPSSSSSPLEALSPDSVSSSPLVQLQVMSPQTGYLVKTSLLSPAQSMDTLIAPSIAGAPVKPFSLSHALPPPSQSQPSQALVRTASLSQFQSLGTLPSQQPQSLPSSPQFQALGALPSQQPQSLGTLPSSPQFQSLGTLPSQQSQSLGTLPSSPQFQALGTLPSQPQSLGTLPSSPQFQALGTLPSHQSQSLGTLPSSPQFQALGTLPSQQSQSLGTLPSSPQFQALGTLPSQQSQSLGTLPSSPQFQALGTLPSSPQFQALGTLASQQPQSLGTLPSSPQFQSPGTLPSQQSQSLGTLPSQQPQSLGVEMLPSQQPQSTGTSPSSFQALSQASASQAWSQVQQRSSPQGQSMGTLLTPSQHSLPPAPPQLSRQPPSAQHSLSSSSSRSPGGGHMGVSPGTATTDDLDDSECEKIVRHLLKVHKEIWHMPTSNWTHKMRMEKQMACYEECKLKSQIFGHTTLSKEEYEDVYWTTGLDVDNRLPLIANFAKMLDAVIRRLISFVKLIPGFCQLSLKDQIRLIKDNRCEIAILNNAEGYNSELQVVTLPSGRTECIHDASKIIQHNQVLTRFQASDIVKKLALTHDEVIILKCWMVVTVGEEDMDEWQKVSALQWRMAQCLLWTLRQTRPDPQRTFARVMSGMCALRQTASSMYTWLHSKPFDQYAQFKNNPLLSEWFSNM